MSVHDSTLFHILVTFMHCFVSLSLCLFRARVRPCGGCVVVSVSPLVPALVPFATALSLVSVRVIVVSVIVAVLVFIFLLPGRVAPLLDDRPLDLPGVPPCPGADLFGDVHAVVLGLQDGHQLCDELADLLRVEVAGLLGHVLGDGARLLSALARALLDRARAGPAHIPRLLAALSLGRVALHRLRLEAAHLELAKNIPSNKLFKFKILMSHTSSHQKNKLQENNDFFTCLGHLSHSCLVE